jgi:tetratricopeptide (TPR) repeat protein
VYCNRATTYYKLGKFSDSERDATKCVTLNHAYAKGYARRGAARRELKNLEGSIADFEKALTVAPNTKEYEKELETSKKALEEVKRATSKRMIIEEVEEDTKPIKIVEEEEIEELITPQASKIQASQPKSVPKQESKPVPKPEPVKQVPKQEPVRQPTAKHVSQVPTQPPKTSYEFEKNLKGLSTQGIQEYIWLIPPESFKSLFKEALTGEIMSTIIHAVESYFLPKEGGYARAVSVLENLAKSERFDITVMFLEDEERKVVEKICQVVEKNTQLSTDTIRKSYL